MNTVTDIANLQATLSEWRKQAQSIALVPTMGGLHQGHLSLVDLAHKNANKVVVSMFVNPAQFSENEDFDTYPRTIDEDLTKLKTQQVDLVFMPSMKDVYPEGIDADFDIGPIGQILCGQTRPHFFNGVLQVVRRLFEIVQPDVAIFGQKDYQQLHIIKHLTSGVKIIAGAIMREPDGLAMSTRNQYLSANERKIALQLHKTLSQLQGDEIDIKTATEQLKQHFKLDYLEALDANTLKQITDNTSKIAILCAVYLGKTRLIDNTMRVLHK